MAAGWHWAFIATTVIVATLLSLSGLSRADDTASVPPELRPAPRYLPFGLPPADRDPSLPGEPAPVTDRAPSALPALVATRGEPSSPTAALLEPIGPSSVRRPGRRLWVTGTAMAVVSHGFSVSLAWALIDLGRSGIWLAVPIAGPLVHAIAIEEGGDTVRVHEVFLSVGQVVGLGLLAAGLLIASRTPDSTDELPTGPVPWPDDDSAGP